MVITREPGKQKMNQNSENGPPSLISVPVKRPWNRRVFILTILLLSAAGAGIYKTGYFVEPL